jgi:4-amino-4-deoxy-L-arabinose transferase-like glycosyltransferase
MHDVSLLPAQGSRWAARWIVDTRTVVVGLALVALAVRLIGLDLRPLWLDEAYSAWFASRGWHELWAVVPTYEPHPPFYYSLLKLWAGAFGDSAVALRLLSVVSAVVTVPVVVALAIEVERQHPTGRPLLHAGVAAFLAACSPMLVLLGQEARPYPLLILGYAIAILGLLRLIGEFASGPGRWRSWLILGGGTELVLWAHGLGALYAICLAAALAPCWLRRPVDGARLIRGLVTASATAAVYLPCLLLILNRAGDWGTGWLTWTPAMLWQLVGLYAVPVEVLTISSVVAAVILLLLIKRALHGAFDENAWDSKRALVLLWLGPPLLAVAISQLFLPVFLPRTLAASLIPAYLAIAGALARTPARLERFALAAGLVITLLPSTLQIALRPPTESWDEVSAYLAAHVTPGDAVWVYPNDSALPLRQAGLAIPAHGIPGDYPAIGIKGPIRAGSPAVVSLTAGDAEALAARPLAAQTVWLVTRQSALFDPLSELPAALARHRRAGKAQHWGYISVQPFTRR